MCKADDNTRDSSREGRADEQTNTRHPYQHSDSRRLRCLAARAIDSLRHGGSALLDAYAPQLCLFCDLPSNCADPICPTCLGELTRNTRPCPRCALPDCGGSLCPQCLRGDGLPCRVIAPFVYDHAIACLMRSWKFEKQRRLASIVAILALDADISGDIPQIAAAVPLHWRRRLQRGFNQSEDLLDAMAKSHPPLREPRKRARDAPGLIRARATPKQSLATRRERQDNLTGAFRVRGDLQGRSVLLIDDVCTTGATAAALTHALHTAGAGDVTLWCVARTPR